MPGFLLSRIGLNRLYAIYEIWKRTPPEGGVSVVYRIKRKITSVTTIFWENKFFLDKFPILALIHGDMHVF